MKKLFPFLFVLLLAGLSTNAQVITFEISSPMPNTETNDGSLGVSGYIWSSTYEIARVTIFTNGRTDTANIYPGGQGFPPDPATFGKSIDVSGFPVGIPLQVVVTVTDIMGNSKSDSVAYTCLPRPPQGFFILPVAGTNGYPSFRIKTSHTGYDTCTSVIRMQNGATWIIRDTAVYNDFDTIININGSISNSNLVLYLVVTDKWGQSNQTYVQIFADNNLFLTPLYTSENGSIKDYNYHRILEFRSDAAYMIPDSNIQIPQALPYSANCSSGRLTPMGAVWTERNSNNDAIGTRELNNDSLYMNAYGGGAGIYTYYTVPFTVSPTLGGVDYYVWNMQTRTSESIGRYYQYAGGVYPTMSMIESGAMTIVGIDGVGVSLYKPGVGITGINAISDNGYGQFMGATTDGKNVLYTGVGDFEAYTLLWHNGTRDTSLGVIGNGISGYPAGYTVANNFIAYPKAGTLGQMQIWLIDSAGAERQITFMGSSSTIIALSPHGDLIYTGPDSDGIPKTFYLKFGAIAPKVLSPVIGTILYRDGAWYVLNGKYLSRLNVNAFRTVANGNWTDGSSWEGGDVPLSGADVIVTTNILVTTNVVCNSLKVVPPGSITVASPATLSVLH